MTPRLENTHIIPAQNKTYDNNKLFLGKPALVIAWRVSLWKNRDGKIINDLTPIHEPYSFTAHGDVAAQFSESRLKHEDAT